MAPNKVAFAKNIAFPRSMLVTDIDLMKRKRVREKNRCMWCEKPTPDANICDKCYKWMAMEEEKGKVNDE